jgi:hypothetical protein
MTIKPIDTLKFMLAMDRESQSRDNPYAAVLKLVNNLGSDLFDANMRAVNNAVRLEVLIGVVRAAIESLDNGDIYTSRSRAAVDSLRDAIGIVQHEEEGEGK